MTLDDALRATFGGLFAALTGVAAWLAREVLGARSTLVALSVEVTALKAQQAASDSRGVTHEELRAALEAALDRRDAQALDRRQEWDRRLALEISSAVSAGLQRAQEAAREEIEASVPRIVREVLAQQGGGR